MGRREIVRLEVDRIVRSPGTWLATAGLLLVLAAGPALPAVLGLPADAAIGTALLLGPGVDIVLPLVVVVFGYTAVAGHRATGTLTLFLATPQPRKAVLLSLFFARAIVLLGITSVALVAAVGAIIVLYGPPPVVPLVTFGVLTAVAVCCLTAIATGVSASVRRPIRALGLLLGGFVLAYGIWEPAVEFGYAALVDTDGGRMPWGVRALVLLNPLESYGSAADGVLPASPRFAVDVDGQAPTATRGSMVGGEISGRGLLGRVSMLVGWASVALAVGYRRLSRADLR